MRTWPSISDSELLVEGSNFVKKSCGGRCKKDAIVLKTNQQFINEACLLKNSLKMII